MRLAIHISMPQRHFAVSNAPQRKANEWGISLCWCIFLILLHIHNILLPSGNCLKLGVDVASFPVATMMFLPVAVVDGSLDARQGGGRTVVGVGVGLERIPATWRRVGCGKGGWRWSLLLLLGLASSHPVCVGRRLQRPWAIVRVVGGLLKNVGSVIAVGVVVLHFCGRSVEAVLVVPFIWSDGDLDVLRYRSIPVVGRALLYIHIYVWESADLKRTEGERTLLIECDCGMLCTTISVIVNLLQTHANGRIEVPRKQIEKWL